MGPGQAEWERFVRDWQRLDPQGSSMVVIGESLGLLGDAATTYDAGAPNATALLCRAAIETAGYLFLTRRQDPGPPPTYSIVPPRNLAGEIRDVSFEEIKNGLDKSGVIGSTLVKAASRIQSDGNFVAHLGSKQDKALIRALDELHEAAARKAPLPSFSARMGVTYPEALKDLQDTVDVFIAIGREVTRQMGAKDSATTRNGAAEKR